MYALTMRLSSDLDRTDVIDIGRYSFGCVFNVLNDEFVVGHIGVVPAHLPRSLS